MLFTLKSSLSIVPYSAAIAFTTWRDPSIAPYSMDYPQVVDTPTKMQKKQKDARKNPKKYT